MKRKSILVVEDTLTQALMLQHLLEGAGYEVRIARQASKALEQVKDALPDLILTDINMPLMNGYEFCQAVKSEPLCRSVPVVLMVSLIEKSDITNIINCGADDIVYKTFDKVYLLERIETVLRNRELNATCFDAELVRCRVDGKEESLSVRPVQLIHMLVSAFEIVVSAKQGAVNFQENSRSLS